MLHSCELPGNDFMQIKKILEACLLTANQALSLSQLSAVFQPHLAEEDLCLALEELALDYADRGIELVHSVRGYRFRSRPQFQTYINQLYSLKPQRYSRALMETIALIAYHQPITRGEIEEFRGVSLNSNLIQILSERGWIEVVGQKQVPGKPELFATTDKFLDDLGLQSLTDLPEVSYYKL